MIRSEFVTCIVEQNPHLFAMDVEAVVDVILDRIAGALADGDRVELRDFGSFCARDREGRRARNPRTGEEMMVPARAHVDFRPGKAMRTRLNLNRASGKREADQLRQTS